MPSSRPNPIPIIIHLVRQLKPQSILDVGVGFGKWGHLFREYTDILEAERDPARYRRQNWKVRIDGIEGFRQYLTEMHRYLYNRIYVGDAKVLIGELSAYDLIFMGDVLEHFEKKDGLEFLRQARARANKALILTTPRHETEQEALCGNELERHHSLWSPKDFESFAGAQIKVVDRALLLVVLARPEYKLKLTPPLQPPKKAASQLRQAQKELVHWVPLEDPFILVDEEQLRGELPHRRVIPFLEKQGVYWGPPPDDATAIKELERLRESGATRLAFTWPAYWWLEHYQEFATYLRRNYEQPVNNPRLKIFDLKRKRA